MNDSSKIAEKVREVVLDTETTGLNPEQGDRIVDIGCVELIDHMPTGNTYQVYLNPQKEMTSDAVRITGLTDEFLEDKPTFSEIVDDFLNFVKDSTLVIHNAVFDVHFLNSELGRLGKPLFKLEETVDTLDMAHRKFPGAPASLDALCKRFDVDTAIREKHGALIDCLLLADVYICLLGGKQAGLNFSNEEDIENEAIVAQATIGKLQMQCSRKAREFAASKEEIIAHDEFLKGIGGESGAMWKKWM